MIVDIGMPPTFSTEGLDAARLIQEELPDIGILVLSGHIDVDHAMELLAGGRAIGCLLKNRVTDVTVFIDTLGRIAAGACVVDPALVQELASASDGRPAGGAEQSRTGGAHVDGAGTVQRGDRAPTVGDRGHGGKARSQHSDEIEPPRGRGRPSTGSGGDRLSREPSDGRLAIDQAANRVGGQRISCWLPVFGD